MKIKKHDLLKNIYILYIMSNKREICLKVLNEGNRFLRC